jgi:hypothetical protein
MTEKRQVTAGTKLAFDSKYSTKGGTFRSSKPENISRPIKITVPPPPARAKTS